jgi:hypothetical protein
MMAGTLASIAGQRKLLNLENNYSDRGLCVMGPLNREGMNYEGKLLVIKAEGKRSFRVSMSGRNGDNKIDLKIEIQMWVWTGLI